MFFKKRGRNYSWKFEHEKDKPSLCRDLLLAAGWPAFFLTLSLAADFFFARSALLDCYLNSVNAGNALPRLIAVSVPPLLSCLALLAFIRSIPKIGPLLFGLLAIISWSAPFIYRKAAGELSYNSDHYATIKEALHNPGKLFDTLITSVNVRSSLYFLLLLTAVSFGVWILYRQNRRIDRPVTICLIFFLLSLAGILYCSNLMNRLW